MHNVFFFDQLYKNLPTYPVYSTLDDTKDYVTGFIDPKYKLHQAVTKVVADVTLRLADSALIPLDVHNYISLFNEGKTFLKKYKSVFNAVGINLGKFKFSCSINREYKINNKNV